jgi:calcineurin-like phosphoesterase family protein
MSMKKNWIASDHHLGHKNILNFLRRDKVTKIRGQFKDIDHHDRVIVDNHNSVVDDNDRVYFLGDLAMSKAHLPKFNEFKGKKLLMKGNHDEEDLKHYSMFENVCGSRDRNYDGRKFIMTHIPLHTDCVERFDVNFHGHLHSNVINDPRYLCVSLEHTGYFPITIEEALDRVDQNKKHFARTGFVIDFSEKYL